MVTKEIQITSISGILVCLLIGVCGTSTLSPQEDYYTSVCRAGLTPDDFLVTYSTENYGCVLVCSILTSSSRSSDFLENALSRTHRLSGRTCVNDSYVCINGSCVINPLKIDPLAMSIVPSFPGTNSFERRPIPQIPTSGSHGRAIIKVHSGHIRFNELLSKGDIYIKVFANTRSLGRYVS